MALAAVGLSANDCCFREELLQPFKNWGEHELAVEAVEEVGDEVRRDGGDTEAVLTKSVLSSLACK